MTGYNAVRFFEVEADAREFAESVGSDSWGWMKNADGIIVSWYVDFNIERKEG